MDNKTEFSQDTTSTNIPSTTGTAATTTNNTAIGTTSTETAVTAATTTKHHDSPTTIATESKTTQTITESTKPATVPTDADTSVTATVSIPATEVTAVPSMQLYSPSAEDSAVKAEKSDTITPLGWYAGFQPLLLTLPETKWLKSVYWLAIRDHKRQVGNLC